MFVDLAANSLTRAGDISSLRFDVTLRQVDDVANAFLYHLVDEPGAAIRVPLIGPRDEEHLLDAAEADVRLCGPFSSDQRYIVTMSENRTDYAA